MKKRMVALLAMIGLVLAAGTAVSVAAEGGEKNCDRSRAYGCDDHPGEHEDDGDGGEGPAVPELSCDALPGVEPSLDEAVQGACATVTAALAGGGDEEPGEEEPEEPAAPSCASIPGVDPAVDGPVQSGCAGLADALAGGGGGEPGEGEPEVPAAPSCDAIPDVEPSLDPTVDEVCATVAEALAG